MEILAKQSKLLARLKRLPDCVVAFSGGVDSAVVAKAAALAVGSRAIAVTAVSPSLATGERDQARALAKRIGIRHDVISTREMDNPAYVANHFDRCFHCKTELYSLISSGLDNWNASVILNGVNADDLEDHRPGIRAAHEYRVLSPLAEGGITKSEVRELARLWQLDVAEKPATPCLSSRIAYGEEVTLERLRRIDQAERWLRQRGFHDVRVRVHKGELARLEVALEDLTRVSIDPFRDELVKYFGEIGFRYVTVDLAGRRSGSLNTLIPVEQLEQVRRD